MLCFVGIFALVAKKGVGFEPSHQNERKQESPKDILTGRSHPPHPWHYNFCPVQKWSIPLAN